MEPLRAAIGVLPSPEREWTLLWLAARKIGVPMGGGYHGDHGGAQLASDRKLLVVAKRIGSEALMEFLRGTPPIDDPDMQQGRLSAGNYVRVCRFILDNARTLLRPVHVNELLLLEHDYRLTAKTHSHLVLPDWAIAAASLDAQRAVPILDAAFSRFSPRSSMTQQIQRARIMIALVGHTADAPPERIVEWFYSESSTLRSGSHGRQYFARELRRGRHHAMLRLLLRDVRLASRNRVPPGRIRLRDFVNCGSGQRTCGVGPCCAARIDDRPRVLIGLRLPHRPSHYLCKSKTLRTHCSIRFSW